MTKVVDQLWQFTVYCTTVKDVYLSAEKQLSPKVLCWIHETLQLSLLIQ